MTAPASGRTADENEMRAQEALALRDELMIYAAQLIRMSTQAGLGGRDLSVRVKEPEHLAHLITRAASAIQARKWAAAEQEAATLRARLQEAERALGALGRDPDGSGSQAAPEAPSDPRPSGVDPSRWELSEETRAFIREIDLATVRPGDPRLSQTLIGPTGPAIGLDGYGSQARPLAPSYDPPRCTATGNPCGTDTCIVGHECPDSRWGGRCAHRIAKRVAALGIEAAVPPEPKGPAEGESPTPQGGMPEILAAKAAPLPDSDTGGKGAA